MTAYTLRRVHAWDDKLICGAPELRACHRIMTQRWTSDRDDVDVEYQIERWTSDGQRDHVWVWGSAVLGPTKAQLVLLRETTDDGELITHVDQQRTGLTPFELAQEQFEDVAGLQPSLTHGAEDEETTRI